jgi:hypothetical protein
VGLEVKTTLLVESRARVPGGRLGRFSPTLRVWIEESEARLRMPESHQRVSVSPSGDKGGRFSRRRIASGRLALHFRESRRPARSVSMRKCFAACHRGDKQPRYATSGLRTRDPLRNYAESARLDRVSGAELARYAQSVCDLYHKIICRVVFSCSEVVNGVAQRGCKAAPRGGWVGAHEAGGRRG